MNPDEDETETEYEAEAIRRAESRFSVDPVADSEFQYLPLMGQRKIRGSSFLCYDNTQNIEHPESNQVGLSEELLKEIPVILYPEKAMFRSFCKKVMTDWYCDLDSMGNSILKAEVDDSITDELHWELTSYGLDLQPDCLTVAGEGPSMFMAKDLFFGILLFYLENLNKRSDYVPFSCTMALDTFSRIHSRTMKGNHKKH